MAGGVARGLARGPSAGDAHPFDARSAFALAAGGLRRLRGDGEAFIGYSPAEMFWRDALELVHETDRARAGRLLAGAVRNPGAVLNGALRLRDAAGVCRAVEATVKNVPGAPGDGGLVPAELREAFPANGHAPPRVPRF